MKAHGHLKILMFGATGMVGRGVLREALLDEDVRLVQTFGRTPTGIDDPRLKEVVHSDLFNYEGRESELSDFDACFFCLGVSSAGMKESDYRRVTFDLTLTAAKKLVELNTKMTFIYVSGQSTDGTEKGRVMWARIKGRTENELRKLGFKGSYAFRPGAILAANGERSSTPIYRAIYTILNPLVPFLRRNFPKYTTTTEEIGRAMLKVTKNGYPTPVLENLDIQKAGALD